MQGKELHYFHGIIERDLSRLVTQQQPLTRHYIHTFNQDLYDEVELIKANITMTALSRREEEKLHIYIQACQKTILILTSHLVEYVSPAKIFRETKKLDHTTICKTLYVSLEDLLRFIESHYPEHIDKNSWIPKRYIQLLSLDISESISRIENGLSTLGVRDDLKVLTLQPFESIRTDDEVSYQRIQYVKELKKALQKFIVESHQNVNDELMLLLFRCNYNSADYCEYNFKLIRDHLSQDTENSSNLEKLALLKKIVHQTPLRHGIAYEVDSVSIKEILSEWIEDEIDYLLILEKGEQSSSSVATSDEDLEKFKIHLSSEEVLLMCYIYVELGIIDKDRISDLARGLSRFASTKRRVNLSWSSLRKKFYNAESRTINSVGLLIKEMQKIIDNLRGLR